MSPVSSVPPFKRSRAKPTSPPSLPPAHHLHHAHLVSALAILGVAATMAVVTYNSVSARVANIRHTMACEDPDKTNPEKMGATTIYSVGTDNKKIKLQETSDMCAGTKEVQETFCSKDGKAILSKVVACGAGKMCIKGACVVPPATGAIVPPPPATGSELQQKGISLIYSSFNTGQKNGTDGSWCRIEKINDQRVCTDSSGVTIKASCTGDVPLNPDCGGKRTGTPPAFSYTALNCYSVKETSDSCAAAFSKNSYGGAYACALDSEQSSAYGIRAYCKDPGPNFTCVNDSDGGNNLEVSGAVTARNNYTNTTIEESDACVSDTSLSETYCSASARLQYASSTVQCPGGLCLNNACVSATATGPTITVTWAGDTPSGATASSEKAIVAKVAVAVPDSLSGSVIIRDMNFAIHQVGFEWPNGNRLVRIYKDNITSEGNLLASADWTQPRGTGPTNTTFTEAAFTDVSIAPGTEKKFLLVMDTVGASTNDILSISMDSDDVVWSVENLPPTNKVSGLPLIPKILTY